MLITHNAMEILVTPGRVTMLGEGDGNRMRRIYTDGRQHPEDPDLTIHGHSIGRWDGDTLVVDTVGIIPQSYIALSEAVGIPNNGGMHIVERIRLRDADTLAVELAITAPEVLTGRGRRRGCTCAGAGPIRHRRRPVRAGRARRGRRRARQCDLRARAAPADGRVPIGR